MFPVFPVAEQTMPFRGPSGPPNQLPKMRSCSGLYGVAQAMPRWSTSAQNPRLIAPSYPTATLIAYFNRIADALGTDLEPEMPPRPEGWGARS